jgi:hypothetical protein
MTTRRLAAILAADVVGFGKLIGEDDAGRSPLWGRCARTSMGSPSIAKRD